MTMFSHFSTVLKEHLETNHGKSNSQEDQKEGIYGFLNQKTSKLFKETDEQASTITNVKLTIQSAQIL